MGGGPGGSQSATEQDPWCGMRNGETICIQNDEPEMSPANKSNLVVKALSSRPYRRGGIWPSRQRRLHGPIPNATVCVRVNCTREIPQVQRTEWEL